jgi:hypothetical protein
VSKRETTYDELERGLETGTHSATRRVCLREHVAQSTQQVLERRLGLVGVDEQVLGLGQEDVLEVADDEHRRVRRAGRKAEEVEGRVNRDDRDLGSAVGVGQSVERLEDRAGSGCDHARLDGGLRDVDEEDVARRLGRSYHVLGRSYELDDARVELRSLPPVGRLVLLLVPVEHLRHLVRQVAHGTLPPVATLDKGHVRVDVGPASSASSDDGVLDDGHLGRRPLQHGNVHAESAPRKSSSEQNAVGRRTSGFLGVR